MSLEASTDDGLTNFLKDISLAEAHPVQRNKPAGRPVGKENKKYLLLGGGVLGGLILLALLAASFKKKAETPVVTAKPAKSEGKSVKSGGDPTSEKWKTPAFRRWINEVERMPAAEQLQAVSKKLRELNPGFDGKIRGQFGETAVVENGIVRGIGFYTDHVSDISPVLALSGLRLLGCAGRNEGNLSDLRPLQGMQLVSLDIQGNQIEDLAPLAGMRLNDLHCFGNPHQSYGKPIKSLAPLKGMPLTSLTITSLEDGDLSPLAGMSMVSLVVVNVEIKDISVLKGMPLQTLSIGNCQITQDPDFSILKDMPLKALSFDVNPERDTELLRSIKTLETINNKPVAEFWKEVEELQKGK